MSAINDKITEACGHSVGIADRGHTAIACLKSVGVSDEIALRVVAAQLATESEDKARRVRCTWSDACDYMPSDIAKSLFNLGEVIGRLHAVARIGGAK